MKKNAVQDVKNIYRATATVAEDGSVTYEKPKKLFDSQKIALSVSTTTDKYYTTDGVDVINSFEGGTLAITNYGLDNATLVEIEGHTVDDNGVIIHSSKDEAPYQAIGFEIEKRNKKKRYVWLLMCKKKIDNEEYEVKEGKINPKSESLTFEITEGPDGEWKYSIDEDDANAPTDLDSKWFEKVYDGKFATVTEA